MWVESKREGTRVDDQTETVLVMVTVEGRLAWPGLEMNIWHWWIVGKKEQARYEEMEDDFFPRREQWLTHRAAIHWVNIHSFQPTEPPRSIRRSWTVSALKEL